MSRKCSLFSDWSDFFNVSLTITVVDSSRARSRSTSEIIVSLPNSSATIVFCLMVPVRVLIPVTGNGSPSDATVASPTAG